MRSETDAAASRPPVLLSEADRGRLRALGLPIVLPTWLPEGFAVDRVTGEVDRRFGAFYGIHLRGPNGAFVDVHATRGGLGDVFRGDSRHRFTNPLFGPGALEWYAGSEEGVDFRSPWMHRPAAETPAFLVCGRGLTPQVAVRVVESLRMSV